MSDTSSDIETFLITISRQLYPETVQRFINDDFNQGLTRDYLNMFKYTLMKTKFMLININS